jgi:D-glycero-alpha-D-manno-heptose 1-phosphate guanylyltransferase
MNSEVLSHEAIAVVLAGGFGTRIQHLLPNLPKPMAAVEDKPFVEWVLRYLKAQGLGSAILSTGYRGEVIAQYFNSQSLANFSITCSQEPSPLGTAGGFMDAVRRSGLQPKAWLVTNGDSLVCGDLKPLFARFADPSVECVILGVPVGDASRYGSLICDAMNRLLNFAEKQPGSGIINGGVYLFRHRVLEQFPPQTPLGFEQEIFPRLLAQGMRIEVEVVDAPFLDIGTPETLPQAAAFIRANRDRFA